MNFPELINLRQSVRRYDTRPVENELLTRCLEAARVAPSASNSQPWYFIVVNETGLKNKVAEATYDPVFSFNKFTRQAPVILVMITETPPLFTRMGSKLKKREWTQLDHGIAAVHFCLQATELGLGTCMIGWFNEDKIQDLLGVPKDKAISLLITLGHPSPGYRWRAKTRKPLDEVVGFNGYKMK